MNKSKVLPERPHPPSIKDVIEDIDNAPKDDVVFSSNNFSTLDEVNKSVAMEESYLDTSDNVSESDNIQPHELAYRQALDFISLQEKLQKAPIQLDEQFEKLQQLETEVSKSIRNLRESSKIIKS